MIKRHCKKLTGGNNTTKPKIVAVELSLSKVTYATVFLNLPKQIRLKTIVISGTGAYDIKYCHGATRIK